MFVVVTVGCTHNDGPSDSIFGTWKLESITVDGVENPDYHFNVVWKFQNNIIEMTEIKSNHEVDNRFGTWKITDGRMLFDFGHSDDRYGSGEGIYSPLKVTLLPPAESVLEILRKDGSRMIFQYIPVDQSVIVYQLKRQG